MLEWICETAKQRIVRGRVVLLENGSTSRAFNLDCFESLVGLPDGLTTDEFEYMKGDQCMLGQHDWESGEPMRGRTLWGTNAEFIKEEVGALCSGDHAHQQIMGSNAFGLRSVQRATWNEEMCAKILRGIVKESRSRCSATAFPAAIQEEINEERGPLDDTDQEDEPEVPAEAEGAGTVAGPLDRGEVRERPTRQC